MTMKVAIAVDGSKFAQSALEIASCLPFNMDKVSILSVAPRIEEQRLKLQGGVEWQIKNEAEKILTKSKEEFEKHYKTGIETKLLFGNPVEKIAQFAKEEKIDLIVLGSRGLNPIKEFLLGGVSSGVVNHTSCSVLLQRQAFSAADKNDKLDIVVGYDDEDASKKMCSMLLESRLQKVGSIDFITCIELVSYYGIDISMATVSEYPKFETYLEEQLKNVAAEFSKKSKNLKVSHCMLTNVIDVASSINNYAAAQKKDLIAVSSNHKSWFEKAMIGSVTSRITHHSDTAVLVIR